MGWLHARLAEQSSLILAARRADIVPDAHRFARAAIVIAVLRVCMNVTAVLWPFVHAALQQMELSVLRVIGQCVEHANFH